MNPENYYCELQNKRPNEDVETAGMEHRKVCIGAERRKIFDPLQCKIQGPPTSSLVMFCHGIVNILSMYRQPPANRFPENRLNAEQTVTQEKVHWCKTQVDTE